MITSSFYGNSSESVGLYGNTNTFGGTYFEWLIFQTSESSPATPTGGSWDFTTNTGIAPTGWSTTPPVNPTTLVWVSIAVVNSKTDTLTWSVPGQFAYSSGAGLPILSGNSSPTSGDGSINQIYIQTISPQVIWFKETGGWVSVVGSNSYLNLVDNQTVNGTKTFVNQIIGSVSGNSNNVTGIIGITNGGTGSTDANSARTALGLGSSSNVTFQTVNATNGIFGGSF